jgi:hypothetical protein
MILPLDAARTHVQETLAGIRSLDAAVLVHDGPPFGLARFGQIALFMDDHCCPVV